jgi:hypothetical protein
VQHGGTDLPCRPTPGPGIAAAEQPKIFDRFPRVEAARTRHVDGIGLGLSLAREIIRAPWWTCAPTAASIPATIMTVSVLSFISVLFVCCFSATSWSSFQ